MQSLNAHQQPVIPLYDDTSAGQRGKSSFSGSMGKFAVTLYHGATSFITSLSPDYVLEHLKTGSSAQTSAIANHTVTGNRQAAFTGDLMEGAWMASTLIGHCCPQVRVITDATAAVCASVRLVDELCRTFAARSAVSGTQPGTSKPLSSAAMGANHVTRAAAALVAIEALDQLAGAAAVSLHQRWGDGNNPIPVGDSATLNKIGRQPGYPLDAFYFQTADIDARGNKAIGNITTPFSGQYDGMCHTVSNQQECLFKSLSGNVENLYLNHADIRARDDAAAVVACEMTGSARVENLRIAHSRVATTGDTDPKQHRYTHAGIVTAHQVNGEVTHIWNVDAMNCSVSTTGRDVFAGIAGGHIAGKVTGLTVFDSKVGSTGGFAYIGIGAGKLDGQISHLSVVNSQLRSEHDVAHAGIGCGYSDNPKAELSIITASNCTVTTAGNAATAAIGSGTWESGHLSEVTAANCTIMTTGPFAVAAVGSGYAQGSNARVSNIKAINTSVTASGIVSVAAGIGVGLVNYAHVENITAVNCRVDSDWSGIAYGDTDMIPSHGYDGSVHVVEESVKSYNNLVNGRMQSNKGMNETGLNHLCATADARFLTNDCRLPEYSWFTGHGCKPLSHPSSSNFAFFSPGSGVIAAISSVSLMEFGAAVGLGLLGIAGFYAGCRYYARQRDPMPEA